MTKSAYLVILVVTFLLSCSSDSGSSGLFPVWLDNKWGFIDKTGKITINPQFDFANPYFEGLAGVLIGNKLIRPTKSCASSRRHSPSSRGFRGRRSRGSPTGGGC